MSAGVLGSLEAGHTSSVRLRVNGEWYELSLDNRVALLDVLREGLGLTGSKKGCDHGQCGACTVLVDGRRVNSCLLLAVALDGARVTTVEGLGEGDGLHPVQEAFLDRDAFQCGYCTPGQICSTVGVLEEAAQGYPRPPPTRTIRRGSRSRSPGTRSASGSAATSAAAGPTRTSSTPYGT